MFPFGCHPSSKRRYSHCICAAKSTYFLYVLKSLVDSRFSHVHAVTPGCTHEKSPSQSGLNVSPMVFRFTSSAVPITTYLHGVLSGDSVLTSPFCSLEKWKFKLPVPSPFKYVPQYSGESSASDIRHHVSST